MSNACVCDSFLRAQNIAFDIAFEDFFSRGNFERIIAASADVVRNDVDNLSSPRKQIVALYVLTVVGTEFA